MADFTALTEYLDDLKKAGIPCCDLLIWQAHQPIYRHFTGEPHPGQAMTGKEMYWLYSATKIVTATVAMQLVERGLLRLDAPVALYLPAFAKVQVRDGDQVRPPRTTMTLEHLLSMQGGLDYDLQTPGILRAKAEFGSKATMRQLVDAMAEKPLLFDPGCGYQYSLCLDVVGACLEAVTGKALSTLAKEMLFDPLGIVDLTFHPSAQQLHRAPDQFIWNDETATLIPIPNDPSVYRLSDSYESGGAGLMGSVEAYMLLADALANDGIGRNGVRILLPETIDNMCRNRQHGFLLNEFQKKVNKPGYGYGLGVRTLIDSNISRSPVGEFGWDGSAGAWIMMERKHQLAAVYSQHVRGHARVFQEFHPAIRDLIYSSLEQ